MNARNMLVLAALHCGAAAIALGAPLHAAEIPAFDLARFDPPAGLGATEDIPGGAHAARFAQVQPDRLAGAAGPGTWLRVTLRGGTKSAEPLVLVLRDARSSRVTLFPPRGAAAVSQTVSGAEPQPRFARDALYFPLGESLRAGDVYYLHLVRSQSTVPMAMTLALEEMSAVNAKNLWFVRYISAVVGALLALGVTALLIGLRLGERAFGYYGANAIAAASYLGFFYGDGYAWIPFPFDAVMGLNAIAVCGLVGAAFNVLFFRELLDLSRYSQRTSSILKWNAIFMFALAAVLVPAGGGVQRVLIAVGNLAVLVATLVMLPSLVTLSARGSRAALFLFGAWSVLNVFVVWRIVAVMRGDTTSPGLYYGLLASMLVAYVLMACGLAERLRHQRAPVTARAARGAPYSREEYGAIVGKLREACSQGRSTGQPTSVLKVQLDHVARIESQHGAPVVDASMTFLLARIRRELREDDTAGRAGDGELLVVLPGAGSATAGAIAERIRIAARAQPLHSEGMSLAATVSVGLAWTQAGTAQPEALMAQAEAAAATADNAGGDQVVALPA